MANLTLVVIAHVDDDRIVVLYSIVPILSAQMRTHVGHVVILWLQSIGYNLATYLHLKFQERLSIGLIGNSNLKGYVFEVVHAVEVLLKLLPMMLRNVHLSVDSFLTHVNAAQTI